MGDIRKTWQAFKSSSEDTFKKAHAKEVLNVHTDGITGYPIKFDKDLGPNLDKYESAIKSKKAPDAAAAKIKALAAVKIYRTRIGEKKSVLGAAADPLEKGLKYVEGKLV